MGSLSLRTRSGLAAVLVALVVAGIWFFTPAPTLAARYVWSAFRAGALALALDQADAGLAFEIGAHYFGSPPAGAAEGSPYDPALAERAFAKALALDPTYLSAHYMRARIEFIRSDFSKALDDLDAELALYPENKRTLYMRALTYAYRGITGDLARAERDFKAFIAWAPSEWAGYNDLAFVLAKEKKYAEATVVLKEGIAKADGGATNPWLWNTLGVMELNLRGYSAALAAFEKARALAAALTEIDWQAAYPGNNPALARDGLEAMKSGIVKNIAAARSMRGE